MFMRHVLYQALIVFILGGVYSFTIAPDLTWAHASADGGDLITASVVNGVPHPAGYPLYLILAKVFQFFPLGSLAFRTNLLSAVATVLASLVLFNLLAGLIKENPFCSQTALLGALAYGLAPAVWAQALVTEVYALHGLLFSVCLCVFLKPNYSEWSRGFAFGLAASNHITSTLIFPILFFYGDRKKIALRLMGIVSSLLLYLILPLRALANPPVNWGNPSTLKGFLWLVSGEAYRGYAFQLSFVDFIERLRAAAGLALDQFTVLGLFLAFYGVLSLRPSPIFLFTLWSSFISLFFSVIYASYDSHVYLIILWVCVAAWMSLGLGGLLKIIYTRAPRLAYGVYIAAFTLLLIRIAFILPRVDVSLDKQAVNFLTVVLEEIPDDAIVFVTGDEYIFSLWYAQFALHRRVDMIIVAEGLLQFDWYLDNLRQTYSLNIKVPAGSSLQSADLISANLSRPVCYLHVGEEIDCGENK